MAGSQAAFDAVKAVVVTTLGIEDRAGDLTPASELLGGLPELDSVAVVELLLALQERFGIEIADDEVVGDLFETLGQLAAFVEAKLGPAHQLAQPQGR